MTAARLLPVSTGLAASLVCLGFTTILWRHRPLHWVRTHSFTSSLYWTARSWLWNYPLTPELDIWDEGDPNEYDRWLKERARTVRMWEFLAPYFAERGYKMYARENLSDALAPRYPTSKMIDPAKLSYPYAPYMCKTERELEMSVISHRVWAARDREGRDVIFKVISGADLTNELKALQLLHSEPLRDDPRNHTIPVIEYIEFNRQTFVVMPRWSHPFQCDFSTIGEVVRFARTFFEALAFLHENNITHGDTLTQNMGMDVLMPFQLNNCYVGYHGPERRYVFIDFEGAEFSTTDGVGTTEFEQSRRRDIALLGRSLETHLRCIEHVAPQINEFLASMSMDKWESLPTATAIFARFEEICRNLSNEELNMTLKAYRWDHGYFRYRKGPPVNI